MDNIPKVTTKKRKKRKFPLTFALSVKVIIQVWKSQKSILETSLITLIDRCKKRRYYKDLKLTEYTDRIGNISVADIIKQNSFYHHECCKTF